MDYKLLVEKKSKNFDNFMSTYKADAYKARVIFFNNTKNKASRTKLVLYEEGENFSFVMHMRQFGISSTNRMYSHESVTRSLRYKDGKFYVSEGKFLKQLTFSWLRHFCVTVYGNDVDVLDTQVGQYFVMKFSWIRFVGENRVLSDKSFNTFVTNKLYNYNDSIKHFLKLPLPTAKVVINGLERMRGGYLGDMGRLFSVWNEMKKVLINVDKINFEMMDNPFFMDLCKMARTLDKKVNCRWGAKRIKEMHDDWAEQISAIVWECDPLRDLSIRPVFVEFAEYSGFRLLRTNKEMVLEGMLQHHCVAGYINSVESWESAIYHIEGYTLELKYHKVKEGDKGNWVSSYHTIMPNTGIYNSQFRGAYNVDAPKELEARVNTLLASFSAEYKEKDNIGGAFKHFGEIIGADANWANF